MINDKLNKPVKAIILSAGQGRRLLPLTEDLPKCLLPVAGKPVIEWQIDALLAVGIDEITIVAGFHVDLVEALLKQRYGNYPQIKIFFNPFFEAADNLASCWLVRAMMDDNFLLLNGDTLFDVALIAKVLESKSSPIPLIVDVKNNYDSDDMKVQLDGDGWVKQVSKLLPANEIDAESIGLIYFREQGPQQFSEALEKALRQPARLKSWYLSIIDELADQKLVNSCSIAGHRWCEIDFIEDLAKAGMLFSDQNKA